MGVSWEKLDEFPLEKAISLVFGAGGLALLRKQMKRWLVLHKVLVRLLFACALLLNLPIYGTTMLVNPKDSTIRPVLAGPAEKAATADADAAKADAQGERISPRILWLRLHAQRYRVNAEAPFDDKDITISGPRTFASLWGLFPVMVTLDAKYEIIGPNGYDIYVGALGHEPHWKSDRYVTIVTLTSGCHQIWIRTDKGETGCRAVHVPKDISPIDIEVGKPCGGC